MKIEYETANNQFFLLEIYNDLLYINAMSLTFTMPVSEQRKVRNTVRRVIGEIFAEKKNGIEEIIFFGSRARGDYGEDSDWDFLVISDNELAIKEKHRLVIQVKRQLARLGIPNDIIIQSRRKFDSMKKYPGNISYAANLEGAIA